MTCTDACTAFSMDTPNHPDVGRAAQASACRPIAALVPESRSLARGQALTFRPDQRGVLWVMQGGVWLTFGLHANPPAKAGGWQSRSGDHFLAAGDSLALAPGEAIVIEAWLKAGTGSAVFCWQPSFASVGVPSPGTARWHANVAPPYADLRQALGLAGGAALRLTGGLLACAAAAIRSVAARLRLP